MYKVRGNQRKAKLDFGLNYHIFRSTFQPLYALPMNTFFFPILSPTEHLRWYPTPDPKIFLLV